MKEATGELNLSVIVVILVAALSFFFFTVLWPMIKGNVRRNASCDEAICECPSGYKDADGKCNYTGNTVTCYYKDKNGNKHDITCAWKG